MVQIRFYRSNSVYILPHGEIEKNKIKLDHEIDWIISISSMNWLWSLIPITSLTAEWPNGSFLIPKTSFILY